VSGSKQLWHVVDKRSMRLSTDADMSRLVSLLGYHSQPLLFESLQDAQTLSRLPELNIRFLDTSSYLNHPIR
jgi:hypothetical protein